MAAVEKLLRREEQATLAGFMLTFAKGSAVSQRRSVTTEPLRLKRKHSRLLVHHSTKTVGLVFHEPLVWIQARKKHDTPEDLICSSE